MRGRPSRKAGCRHRGLFPLQPGCVLALNSAGRHPGNRRVLALRDGSALAVSLPQGESVERPDIPFTGQAQGGRLLDFRGSLGATCGTLPSQEDSTVVGTFWSFQPVSLLVVGTAAPSSLHLPDSPWPPCSKCGPQPVAAAAPEAPGDSGPSHQGLHFHRTPGRSCVL